MKRYFALIALLSAPLFAMQPTNTKWLQAMLRNKSQAHKMHNYGAFQNRFASTCNDEKKYEEKGSELKNNWISFYELQLKIKAAKIRALWYGAGLPLSTSKVLSRSIKSMYQLIKRVTF